MADNKRIFDRLEGVVNVRYGVKGRDKEKIESLPRNIGGGGLGVYLTEKLEPGTVIELEITVPDNPQKAIRGVGEVLWTKHYGTISPEQGVNLHETGIRFVDINPLAVGRVYTYHSRQADLS
ncbi:PilZ domain-containing protein [Candidatus Omnitrophota bacterium]